MLRILWSVLIFGSLFTTSVLAEVYRWTDEEGKVHYSDRKLASDAEDITAKVSVQNIDTSQDEHRKLQQLFRKENDADRAYLRQQEQQNGPSSERVSQCEKLRHLLIEASGRVQLVDQDGKEKRFTEKDQQKLLSEMRAAEQQHCSDVTN